MKRIKFLAMAALALTVGLSSCSKDNNVPVVDHSNKLVILSVAADQLGTRAIDAPAIGLKTTITTGQIFFTNSSVITHIFNISTAATAGDNVNNAALTAGVRLEQIKADHVHILVNKSVTANIGDNISVVNNSALGFTDVKSTFAKAMLLGNSVLTLVSADEYSAKVKVAPITTRIEISKIEDVSVSADYTFDFDGIYINNVYTKMTVGGVVDVADMMTNKLNTDFVTPYLGLTGATTILNDTYTVATTPNTEGVKFYTPASDTWAYSFFPAKRLVDGDDLIPHIILRMKNLKKGGVLVYAAGTDFFITVRTYTGKTHVDFKPGFAYKIASVKFDASKNGSTLPEDNMKNVTVEVQVVAWQGLDITADVN